MNVIQWIKQGGRKYPEGTNPLGNPWESFGHAATGGTVLRRLLVGIGL